ncbi:hypothetical protein EI94DRAFT_1014239 [Lactarius quietus]|nr:hypothetical protein EI94DRAFT_1014239 [Lactarius quietus]
MYSPAGRGIPDISVQSVNCATVIHGAAISRELHKPRGSGASFLCSMSFVHPRALPDFDRQSLPTRFP